MTSADSSIDRHAVRMSSQQWQFIDATIDNEVSVAAEDGEASVVDIGSNIRRAGWDQLTPLDPVTGEYGDWPPAGEEVGVALSTPQWSFVLSALQTWADLSDEQDKAEASGREIRALITAQLP